MIVHDNPEGFGDCNDVFCHANIRRRGRRVAGGVVMGKNERAGAELQSPSNNLARIDRSMVDRADALYLVGDQGVALVQK